MRDGSEFLLDDIDLITLGHAPGGATQALPAAARSLDLSGRPPHEWPATAVVEARRLVPGASIVIVTDAAPDAMLDALYAGAGDAVMIEYLATGPEHWASAITRIA